MHAVIVRAFSGVDLSAQVVSYDASPAEPEVRGSLRDCTDRALSEAGGDPTARSTPV